MSYLATSCFIFLIPAVFRLADVKFFIVGHDPFQLLLPVHKTKVMVRVLNLGRPPDYGLRACPD
jgi:hypothetical protein